MEGITKESIIEDAEEGPATRDVGLILAGQKVEHYEILTYSGLATEELKNKLVFTNHY
jgi:ferritin-like metal-binding protein YciE